ncbi:MAG: hypothetical protein DMG49_03220 [Acidobacteria bacterium]|nr:MAG: hypothetical protein DMG49_03220 [Acidobacteriota bacterium]
MVCRSGSVATALLASRKRPDAVEQEKDKKEEKKDEKKDEKKGLPLKSDRKVEFTTDEGTWLSLDVSPDGKTIVFELVGDIFTLPIEGGQAKLISGGMAFDSQPKFSPDGQWITFISDREGSENIWIMHPDGTGVKQVSKDPNSEFTSPNWAPDGKYVFVSKAQFGIGSSEIWMYHVDGGSGVQITKSKPTPTTERSKRPNAMGVVASPDGKYLYYAAKLGSLYYNQQLPTWHIARRDRKTGDEDNLIHQIKSAFRPVLSPDGKQILYVTRYETATIRNRSLPATFFRATPSCPGGKKLFTTRMERSSGWILPLERKKQFRSRPRYHRNWGRSWISRKRWNKGR